MQFKGKTLTGAWTCERCGVVKRPLQISPLNWRDLSCPECHGALVFVPDFVPVAVEDGLKLFAELKQKISHV